MSSQYQMKSSAQRKVKALPGNLQCCDCGSKDPDWASLSFGVMFCLQCSGVHRSLGTHISFVRSVDMDSWTSEQIKVMKIGGNQQCNDFLQQHGGYDPFNSSIREKYDNPVAQLYKETLKARLDGKTEPSIEDLPPPKQTSKTSNSDPCDSTKTSSVSEDDDNSDDVLESSSQAPNPYVKQLQQTTSSSRSTWVESARISISQRLGWMSRTAGNTNIVHQQ